jgi:hypothetical protein
MTISQDRASSFVDRHATEAKRARSNRPPKRSFLLRDFFKLLI